MVKAPKSHRTSEKVRARARILRFNIFQHTSGLTYQKHSKTIKNVWHRPELRTPSSVTMKLYMPSLVTALYRFAGYPKMCVKHWGIMLAKLSAMLQYLCVPCAQVCTWIFPFTYNPLKYATMSSGVWNDPRWQGRLETLNDTAIDSKWLMTGYQSKMFHTITFQHGLSWSFPNLGLFHCCFEKERLRTNSSTFCMPSVSRYASVCATHRMDNSYYTTMQFKSIIHMIYMQAHEY